jgi:CHRD domain-containing protein
MRLRSLIALAAVAAAVAVPTLAFGAASATTTLTASLAGSKEAPKAGAGSAKATITISTGKVCWKFTGLKSLPSPSAAHIHKGAAGKSGGVFIPLGAAFKLSGCIAQPAAAIKAVLAHPGNYYVNIHTKQFPNGAARGQLAAAPSSSY